MRDTVGILGTPIDILDTNGVLARLEQFIREDRFHQVATANTDFLINAVADPELRHILRTADLIMPDGMPIVWASRLMRSPLPERVTGADIVPALAELAARKGYRLYMLGARPEVAQRARANLLAAHPQLQIVGCSSPPASPLIEMDNEAILADIARAQPDILLVAFGNPKQEKWIHWHRDRLNDVPVCIGVGGTFDFLAGLSPRAPGWMQRVGLEWSHRLLHDPRRLWRRYVRDIWHFSRFLLRQWWALRSGTLTGDSDFSIAQIGDCTVLSVVGDFNGEMLSRFQDAAEAALDANTDLLLDLRCVRAFDAEALGTLLNLPKRAAYCGREVRLFSPPPAVRAAMRRSLLQDGLYPIVETLTEAFTSAKRAGLRRRVLCGEDSAVVVVSGECDHPSALTLERVCGWLLRQGKRLDLDLRGVTYADTHFVALLHRLASEHGGDTNAARIRIVPGQAFRFAMQQQKARLPFVLREAPELPANAEEITPDTFDMLPQEIAEGVLPISPRGACAKTG